jgi:hypothetical protein
MHVVVPLAGPDFVRADGSIKALTPFQGKPLLKYALESRPWSSEVIGYSFILHDCAETRSFVSDHLSQWYPQSSVVYLSTFTRGAACSALAGVAIHNNFNHPLIVDLADILYTSDLLIESRLQAAPQCGGIALTFKSKNSQYSYLRCDEGGKVVEAAEKNVISDNASAGTYIFRNCSIYLRAVAHALDNEQTQVYKNLFYVCPVFNGVLAQGRNVELEQVHNVIDIKIHDFSHA